MGQGVVETWTVDDVAVWAIRNNLEGAASKMLESAVDGKALTTLSDADLSEQADLTPKELKALRAALEGAAAAPPTAELGALGLADGAPPLKQEGSLPSINALPLGETNSFRYRATETLTVSPELLQQYEDTIAKIARLEQQQVEAILPPKQIELNSAQQRLQASQGELQQLQAELPGLKENVEKERTKFFPGKLLKVSSQEEKHERKVQLAEQKLKEAEAHLRELPAQIAQLQEQSGQLQAEVSSLRYGVDELSAARQHEANVVESIFVSGAGADAQLLHQQTELAAMGPRLVEMKNYRSAYSQAGGLLRSADQKLVHALQTLKRAMGASMMGAIGPRRHNVGMDMIMIQATRQAAGLAQAAQQEVMQAKSLLPSLPNVDMRQIQALGGIFFFGGFGMDMVAMMRIRQEVEKVESIEAMVGNAYQWASGWLENRIKPDLAKLEGEHRSLKHQVDAHRRELLAALIAKEHA